MRHTQPTNNWRLFATIICGCIFLFLKMFCLHVVIAFPDYKRPSAEVSIKHYSTKELAENALQKIKHKFVCEYVDPEDFFPKNHEFNDGQNGELNEDDLKAIEKLDKMIESGELVEYYYQDSYMEMPPFDARIFEVVVEE